MAPSGTDVGYLLREWWGAGGGGWRRRGGGGGGGIRSLQLLQMGRQLGGQVGKLARGVLRQEPPQVGQGFRLASGRPEALRHPIEHLVEALEIRVLVHD